MGQRGRKSAASLAIIAAQPLPDPPEELTKKQAVIWKRIVQNEGPNFFRTGGVQELLKDLCRHSATVDCLDEAIAQVENRGVEIHELRAYDKLLMMRAREITSIVSLATKLRLTNQSRYQSATARAEAKEAALPTTRPWGDDLKKVA